MKEAWSLHPVKRCWRKPAVLGFNDWLRDKDEAHERMRVSQNKSQPENTSKTGFQKPTKKFCRCFKTLKTNFDAPYLKCRLKTHSGVVLSLMKRSLPNGRSSQLKIGCVLPA